MRKYYILLLGMILPLLGLWAQTTIDFDTAANWVAGSVALGSYTTNHSYTDGLFSATGGPALRQTTTSQDGQPGAFGTYAWRLKDVTNVNWVITIASGGVADFSLKIRRWDGIPSPDMNLEYSTDGSNWNLVSVINNANLDESSAWKLFSGSINSSASNIQIRLIANGETERIMIDDFSWNPYSGQPDPELSIAPSELSGFEYLWNSGPSVAQSFNVSGSNLSTAVTITAPSAYEISANAGSGYASSLNLFPISGMLASTDVYVRLKADLALGSYSQELSLSSSGLNYTVSLSGDVLPLELNAPVALAASEISPGGFRANWQAVTGATSYQIDLYTRSGGGQTQELFFSEYIEGSSYNKALEIYNGTGSPVNLSDYQVMLFSNGASSASTTLTLSGVLDHNDVYTLAHSNADFALTSLADYINNGGVLNYNGDDALALYKVSTQSYVDIFGVIDDDPGDAWTAGDLSTVDKTLVRKPGVTEGINQNPTGTGSSAFTTLGTEWDSYAVDTFSYFGSHNLRQRSLSYIYQDLDVGNVQSFLFSGLDSDVQYFYVVRASNAYVSSDDSNEISVFTQSVSTPTIQSSNIEAAVASHDISLEWTPGNGARRIVVMNTTNYFSTPQNGTNPAANPVYSGSGQQVVYNGATEIIEGSTYNGVFVEGLQPNTTYHFRVFDYNGTGPQTMYLSSTATGNPASFSTLNDQYIGYYEGISGYGSNLKSSLHDLLRTTHTTKYSYDALWTQLRYTDEDPANTNNIIQIYTGWSIPKSHYGGGVTQWNREHTWSKSHGDFGESRPAGTDLHHMRPCDATVNSAKGNKDFDEGGNEYIDASPYSGYSGATGNYTTSSTWEPRDEEKGDVARMIMYMAVRYEGTDTSYDLEIVDYNNSSPSGQPYYGKLSTMLQWHAQDPVDAWEIRRNERIFERQGNRNPFVDYPEFAQYLWTPVPQTATNVTLTSFTANWSVPITGSSYYLQVSTDSLFASFVSGYSNYNAGTQTSKVITGLSAGTTYFYRLRTYFTNGYSMYSPLGRVSLPSPEPVQTPLSIEIVAGDVRLTISPVAGAISYKVFASDTPDGEFSDISSSGNFSPINVWTSPIGDTPRRFFKAYAIR
ncbi:MAG: endonuclease [Candidatus Cloacimonadaceae bacterium]|nr:endonuclease [Candidatus Cloacimonadaceae bacterium]